MTSRHSAPAPSRPATAVRAVLLTARGLFAAAVGTAVLVGMPWGLLHYSGCPLPSYLPSLAELRTDLTTPILGDTFYLRAIAVVLWLLWGMLVASVLIELVAAARQVPVPRVPGLGPGQVLAALLITAIGVTALLGRSAAPSRAGSIAAVPQARAAATATILTTGRTSEQTALRTGAPTAPRYRLHEVKPGESLSSIAEADLGNEDAWNTLFKLNAGLPQPDGQTLEDPDLIRPGWQIRIAEQPAEPSDNGSTPHAPPPTPHSHLTPSEPDHHGGDALAPDPQPSAPAAPAQTVPSRPPVRRSGGEHVAGDNRQHEAHEEFVSPVWVELAAGGALALGTMLALRAALRRKRTLRRWHRSCYWPTPDSTPEPPHDEIPLPLRPARTITLHPDRHTDTEQQTARQDESTEPSRRATTNVAEADLDPMRRPLASPAPQPPGPTAEEAPPDAESPVAPIPIAMTADGSVITLNDLGPGVGLSGPGALGAARAIAAAALACDDPARSGARLLIPRADAALLLDVTAAEVDGYLGGLSDVELADDLSGALGFLEEYLTYRTRQLAEYNCADLRQLAIEHTDVEDHPPVVLMAVARPDLSGRLAAGLAAGAQLRLHAVLLGTHPSGENWGVDATHQITTDSDLMTPTRTFHMAPSALRHALELLGSVHRHANRVPDPPAAPDPHGRLAEPDAPQPDDARRTAARVTASTAEPVLHAAAVGDEVTAILDRFENAAARIRVLGDLTIETTSGPVETGIRSGARRLAGRLAVHHHRGQSGDELAELWPDLEPKKLTDVRKTDLKSLRDAIKRDVRKGTGSGRSAEFIPRLSGRYRLDPRFVAVDLAAFEQLRTLAARTSDMALRVSAAESALAFYERELLAGNDEEWVIAPRAAIRRDALSTATLLAQLAEADGDHERALAWWERARSIDDNEEVYRQIMRTQARLGRHADVIATRDLLIAKLEPIGEYPAPATRALLADLMAERPHPMPAPDVTVR